MFDKLLQPSNVLYLIFVTPSGITTLTRLLQFSNAQLSIVFTLSGIVISVKLTQSENVSELMFITPSSIIAVFKVVAWSVITEPVVCDCIFPLLSSPFLYILTDE
jgi:hypothetical protein